MKIRSVLKDGNSIVWCGEKGNSHRGVFEVQRGRPLQHTLKVESSQSPSCMSWNRRQTLIALGMGTEVCIHSWPTGELVSQLSLPSTAEIDGDVTRVTFIGDGEESEVVVLATSTGAIGVFPIDSASNNENGPSSSAAMTGCTSSVKVPTEFGEVVALVPLRHELSCLIACTLGVIPGVISQQTTGANEQQTSPPEGTNDGGADATRRSISLGAPLEFPVNPNATNRIVDCCVGSDNLVWIALQSNIGVFEAQVPYSLMHVISVHDLDARLEEIFSLSWDRWSDSSSENNSAMCVGAWTVDRCIRVHDCALGKASAITLNNLLGEASPLSEGEVLVWCGAFSAQRRMIFAKETDFVGLDEALADGDGGDAAVVDSLISPVHEATPRQDSEDTVLVTDALNEPEADDARSLPLPSDSAKEPITTAATDEPLPQRDHGQQPPAANGDTAHMQETSMTTPAAIVVGAESNAEATIVTTTAKNAACDEDTKDRNADHTKKSRMHVAIDDASSKSAPSNQTQKEVTKSADRPPKTMDTKGKPVMYRVISPALEEPSRRPRVPVVSHSPKKVDERPNQQQAARPRKTPAVESTCQATSEGTSAAVKAMKSGPGIDIALDTDDLDTCRDVMDLYILTKLMGEGRDVPVCFVPVSPQCTLAEIRQKLEHKFQKRLSVAFATPAGKLIELRPSTFKLFQSFNEDAKQLYCRALFPVFPSAVEDGDRPPRAHSALDDVSAIHRSSLNGSAMSLDKSLPTIITRKLTKEQQSMSCSRLCETSVELSRRTKRILEKKFWPVEANPTVIPADREKELTDRLYHGTLEQKKKKLAELQKKLDEETFGKKPHTALPMEEYLEVGNRFYSAGLRQYEKLAAETERRQYAKPQFKQLNSAEEWAAWQESMSRTIGKKLKIKDPYLGEN